MAGHEDRPNLYEDSMRRPYSKPRIIPRTERHLWPREARILDERMMGGFGVEALRRFNAMFTAGSRRGMPTADEQDERIRRDEIEALWARR